MLHLAGLGQDGLAAVWVGGVGGDALLDEAGLHGDHAHRDAAQPRPAHHHQLAWGDATQK